MISAFAGGADSVRATTNDGAYRALVRGGPGDHARTGEHEVDPRLRALGGYQVVERNGEYLLVGALGGVFGLEITGPLVAKTIRRKFLAPPGRITRRARRPQLHPPSN